MNKRLLALLLVLLMTVPMAACSETDAGTSDPSSSDEVNNDVAEETESETVPPESDDLPEKSYGGADITIYTEGYLNKDHHHFYNIYEETGTVVNDAAYRRNITIEERFDINLRYTDDAPKKDMSPFRNSVAAGAMEFDLVTAISTFLTDCISEGYFLDLNSLDYVNLSKSYYQHYINEEMEMIGKQFTASGYFDMATLARTYITYFSTQLAEDYHLGNFYELVDKNEWTFDKMLSLAESAFRDADGNGIMNEGDQFGLCGGYNMNSLLSICTGYRFTTKNEDGTRRSTGYTEDLLDFNTLLLNTYEQNWYYNCYVYGEKDHTNDVAIPNFIQNNYLFFLYDVSAAQNFGAEMEDYGILPIPKYKAEQEVYMSYCRPAMTAVPSDVSDPERSGILLEALNYESKKTLLPAYYDISLSHRYASSPEASAILDIIFENVACDFAQNWYRAIGLTPYLHTSIGINPDYVSYYRGVQKAFDKKLEDIFASVQRITEGN